MLESWKSLTLLGKTNAGYSQPLIIKCVCQDGKVENVGNKSHFVVKGTWQPEVKESTFFREALGCLLADYFGLPVPKPALISVNNGFINGNRSILKSCNISMQPGTLIGTEMFTNGYTSVIPDMRFGPELTAQATVIYAYDLLVANSDRVPANPNCAILGQNLIAYDFGLAFGFVNNNQLTALNVDQYTGIAKKHLFFPHLKNQKLNLNGFAEKLRNLNENLLVSMVKAFPREWMSLREPIFDYLLAASERYDEFEVMLQDTLT